MLLRCFAIPSICTYMPALNQNDCENAGTSNERTREQTKSKRKKRLADSLSPRLMPHWSLEISELSAARELAVDVALVGALLRLARFVDELLLR